MARFRHSIATRSRFAHVAALLIAAVTLSCLASPDRALADPGSTLRLTWAHLVPRDGVPADPIASLSEDDRFDFENYLWLKGLTAADLAKPENRQTVFDVNRFLKRLEKSGRSIDALVGAKTTYEAALAAFGNRLVDTHAGKRVAISGYLLPLAFDPAGVREFLLVPYVGACIHVPPPPANQIVLVTTDTPFVIKDTFTAAEITGTFSASMSRRALTLVDGSDDIAVGYAISAAKVKPIAP